MQTMAQNRSKKAKQVQPALDTTAPLKNGRGQLDQTPEVVSSIPPHLAGSSWINFEVAAALSVHANLIEDVSRLKKKASAPRVHKSRVSLRRWFSIWSVLVEDGWETKKFRKDISKPLRRLLKLLGGLRDLDVNIEMGELYGVAPHLLVEWAGERQHQQKQLSRYMASFKVKKLKGIEEFLLNRAEKVERRDKADSQGAPTAFHHLGQHVADHENNVAKLVKTAKTSEELHELRLQIKKWRYMLTEFFGLTNLELVRAQQLLGQIHDLDRLTPLVSADVDSSSALAKIEEKRQELFGQFKNMRNNLPYGLRPSMTSVATEANSDNDFHEIST